MIMSMVRADEFIEDSIMSRTTAIDRARADDSTQVNTADRALTVIEHLL